jgi:hypothetical protein
MPPSTCGSGIYQDKAKAADGVQRGLGGGSGGDWGNILFMHPVILLV